MLLLLLLLLPVKSFGFEDKYDKAIRTTKEAVLKQTGLEDQFNVVKGAAQTKVNKWIKANGLSTVTAVGAVVVPILYYKTVRFHTGDFTFEGKQNRVEGQFQIQF